MRIAYIGCVDFSEAILVEVIKNNGNVVAVITKKKSVFNSDFVDLSIISKKFKIPSFFVEDINSIDTLKKIKNLNVDIIFCFGWSTLIKKELLKLPKYGVIGFHPSLLPRNRGRHPIIWPLVLGLNETGSTFFKMDEGADTGDILSQKKIVIENSDNAKSLYEKIKLTAIKQVIDFMPSINSKTFILEKQNHDLANSFRKRAKKDGIIDFRMSAKSIYNLIRGLSYPYPGAIFIYQNIEYNVFEAKIIKCIYKDIEPGKVLDISENAITLKCGDDAIQLLNINIPELKINEYL
jgi:methionyl-tRNA formyltransferase